MRPEEPAIRGGPAVAIFGEATPGSAGVLAGNALGVTVAAADIAGFWGNRCMDP